jgi:threonine dehydrogenase-like Zn-dependent dehydrogenase
MSAPSADPHVTAVTVTAPGEVALISEIPRWSGPLAADEVFGETVCTLISPGTELAGAFRPDPSRETRYPTVPGYAAVFQVTEIGEHVTTVAVGDLVFTHGGHRSHERKPAAEVFVLPDGLDPFVAVFARLMTVPMATLSTTAARPGSRVGISGLGPIGHLAAVAFAASGFDVTAWDPRADRRELLPAGIRSLDAAPEGVERAQYGTVEGFDLVLECSGHDGAVLPAVRSVRSLGEVVLVGSPWVRRTDTSAHELLAEIFHRYVVLRSGWEWQVPAGDLPFHGASAERNLALAMRWLHAGTVRVDHLADRFAPSDAQAVFDTLAEGRARELTALFDWRQ